MATRATGGRVGHTAAACPSTSIVYVLTALAAVVVVLTRLRLGGEERAPARLRSARARSTPHTVVGRRSPW